MESAFDILVVEDNRLEIRLMKEAFEGPNVRNRLHSALDGEQAMAFLRRSAGFETSPRPNLILLDINMPRKNGLDVLAEIKADPALCSIPTVMLTSSAAKSDIDRAYSLHANGYVRKPVDFDDFMAVMGTIESFWAGVATLPTTAAS